MDIHTHSCIKAATAHQEGISSFNRFPIKFNNQGAIKKTLPPPIL